VRSDAQGVLVIWNDIDEIAETDFLNWHVREHMPERVRLPGFLRGQRYIAVEGGPKYFNFYEATDAATFNSDQYRERLNKPTAWTRQVLAHFRNTARTICKRVGRAGAGDGAFVETLRVSADIGDEFAKAIGDEMLPRLVSKEGIVAASLLQGLQSASSGVSAEKKLSSEPDQIADWVLITEAVSSAFLTSQAHKNEVEALFRKAGAASDWRRAVYHLQFSLSHS